MHSSNDDLDTYVKDVALLPLTLRRLPLQSFKTIMKPGVQTIREAMDQANWSTIWVQLTVLVLIASVVEYLFYLVSALLRHLSVFESFWSFQEQPSIALNVLMMPLFAFVSVVVLHWMARLLRGQGAFLVMLYTNLLFQVPLLLLIIISSILLEGGTWLTIARNTVLFSIQLYIAVLQVFTLRAVHGLSLRWAVTGVLLLVVLFLPLALLFGVIIL
ncbi:hypothetical protein KSD_65900 [Ktedonobacter sp. SOSP1-85]|uniref:YIP1 family protein n=1 Tax=Ktedonobacter sp. SOSP1-85 TaxID=2778367 RepID=UPI0019169233|nr:YIP1 family protein [Ktedonobacter sp. SOSP1-85]GHO78819.1 hypothetical protein KSD_65900 [Ktedonobacter sp. SOSP1-85]